MALSEDRTISDVAKICHMLTDETRVRILSLLANGDRNVKSLMECLNRPQSSVSSHLGLLRMSGLIDPRRQGQEIFYSLSEAVANSGTKMTISLPSCRVTFEQM
jgi:ArsR family transcriptional regulator